MRTPSLYTRWLQRREKWMTQPDVVAADLEGIGSACYYRPWRGEVLIGGRHYDRAKGIIVLDPAHVTEDREACVVAHEWRHHWQFMTGREGTPMPVAASMWQTDYRAAIVEYFKQPHELDALRFSLRCQRSDLDAEWAEWIGPDLVFG